jgi:hypothetical protein
LTSLPFAVEHEKRWTHFGLAMLRRAAAFKLRWNLSRGSAFAILSVVYLIALVMACLVSAPERNKPRIGSVLNFVFPKIQAVFGGLGGRWLDITHFAELVGKNAIQFRRQPCYL